jgi:hypothetical protein
MIRTVISLSHDDKAWLDRAAAARGVTMAALVREAVRRLRAGSAPERPSFQTLLEQTRGLWPEADGLDWQDRLRDEW